MILYPHEFDLYYAWVRKINDDIQKILDSGTPRGNISFVKITDYSNDSGTMTKAYGVIELLGEIVLPKQVKPISVERYNNCVTGEANTKLKYVFDVDTERGV